MNSHATAAVIPIRPTAGSPGEAVPKVLNDDFLCRLRTLNDTTRWLRSTGHRPVDEQVSAEVPMVHVSQEAANLLISEARGFSGRLVGPGKRLCSVVLKGCLITWFEQI